MFKLIWEYLKERFKEPSTWKGAVGIIASVVMYFTPDNIDQIIMAALGLMGITDVLRVENK